IYNLLPSDGTAIALLSSAIYVQQVLGQKGIRFDATKYNWIGRLDDTDPILVVRNDAAVQTVHDLFSTDLIVGVPGAGSASVMTLSVVRNLLGAKLHLISGYSGGADIRLAVERNEVQGVGSVLWRTGGRDWVRQHPLRVLYQVSSVKAPDLQAVPRLAE